jgi:hypothetical protein
METELTALDTASAEAEWLLEFLSDLPVVEKPIPAILMNYDNQTVITKVNSAKDNAKSTRHVKPLFSSPNSPPNFTMQKEDSLSHQNVGKCMEY